MRNFTLGLIGVLFITSGILLSREKSNWSLLPVLVGCVVITYAFVGDLSDKYLKYSKQHG